MFLMINYINSIYSEKYEPEKNDKNEKKINPNFLEKYYDRILDSKNEPFIFYYLSLIFSCLFCQAEAKVEVAEVAGAIAAIAYACAVGDIVPTATPVAPE